MLNASDTIKNLYKSQSGAKSISAYFPALGKTYNEEILQESIELIESINSSQDLVFGSCEAAQVKFTLIGVNDNITGLEFELYHNINGNAILLGIFTVKDCKRIDNTQFKEVLAYDRMLKADIEVADWYNSLTYPMTLASFRASLLEYLGIPEDTSNLPLANDSMIVEKTIETSQLAGREALRAIEALNGAFGKINRYGAFSHKILKPTYGLYPGTFYPGQEYPRSENDTSYVTPNLIDETITESMKEETGTIFAEYTVPEIDKLIIRAEEDDIGAIVGTGTNAYVMEGNFLVFGKSAAELQTIATKAFGYMSKRPYRPYDSSGNIGLPYAEAGDMILFDMDEDVKGYLLQRTLRGTESLTDEFTATGSKERSQITRQNVEITKLKYKTAKFKVDIDGVLIDVSDLESATSAQFTVVAGEIDARVEKNGVIAAINLTSEEAKIQAGKIIFEGLVTANNNFKINLDGSIEAVNGKFSGQITGSGLISENSSGRLEIAGTDIKGYNAAGTMFLWITASGSVNTSVLTALDVYCTRLNNATPITSSNIGSQSVSYATNANNASNADNAGYATNANYASSAGLSTRTTQLYNTSSGRYAYISAADNLIPNSSGMYLGSSSNYWAGAYLGSGPVVTSDRNKKNHIGALPDRYKLLAKKIKPFIFKYNDGTSGRTHVGFIAQQVEEAMIECGISDMEFAALIKSPIYAKKILDENGNETQEYDITSEIIGYDYGLRYEEIFSLLFALLD